MRRLDAQAIVRGAWYAAAVAVPAAVIQNLVDDDSSLRGLFLVVILAGFVFGGFVAGREVPSRAQIHGGLAALLGYGGVLVFSILVRSARGAGLRLGSVPASALLALSCGVVGGYLAFRRSTMSSSRMES